MDRGTPHGFERRCGAVAAGIFALNPNVLYLQSTPMTEPLLMALTLASVALLMAWCDAGVRAPREALDQDGLMAANANGISSAIVGVALALACMTRYEAWPVTAAALVAASLGALAPGGTA